VPNHDEGYIKYTIHWENSAAPNHQCMPELSTFRNVLHDLGLIDAYPDGIGFGNISHREKENRFIISGTQTGHIAKADASHFSLVNSCTIENNELFCIGPIKASSEALTHFAFYAASPEIQSVIHVHHLALWEKLLHQVSTVPETVAYGTTDMAKEIKKIILTENVGSKIIVTAGHREGIFTFGDSLQAAFDELMIYYLTV